MVNEARADSVAEVGPTREPSTLAELVQQARVVCDGIIRSSRDTIRYKFALGELVCVALRWAHHEDAAVVRLAAQLTEQCGRLILPQRLYEAARLFEAFGGKLDRIWEFERRLPGHLMQPLTFTLLIQQILPRVTKERAWNAREWEYYQEEQYGRLERAVEQIESLDRRQRQLDERAVSAPAEEISEAGDSGSDSTSSLAAQALLHVCRESPAYQHFSTQVLLHSLQRTAAQLMARHEQLTPVERRCVADVREQLAHIETGDDKGGMVCAA